jgi:hypothetical protein
MKFALIGATVVAAAAFATPVLAQAVISDPGYCAQFWQNGNATMPRHAVRHTHRHEAVK